jgi:transglutaminase-like putative cysteine protease
MVEQSTGDPRLRGHVASLVRDYQVPARNPEALSRAVQHHAQHRITYMRERPETYASAARTLEWAIGDCDDLTILIAATLRGCRIPCRAVFCGWTRDPGPIPLLHVYPEAHLPGRGWTALEAVRPVPFGFRADEFKRAQGLRTRAAPFGDPTP